MTVNAEKKKRMLLADQFFSKYLQKLSKFVSCWCSNLDTVKSNGAFVSLLVTADSKNNITNCICG